MQYTFSSAFCLRFILLAYKFKYIHFRADKNVYCEYLPVYSLLRQSAQAAQQRSIVITLESRCQSRTSFGWFGDRTINKKNNFY